MIERVIIIGIQSAVGIASLWSLAKKNIKIIGVSHSKTGSGLYSRFLEKGYVVKFSIDNEYEYVKEILKIAVENHVDGILCHHELQMVVLNKYRSEIEPKIMLLFPDKEIMAKILDKIHLLKVATKLNIKVPNTQLIREYKDVEMTANNFNFPAIAKVGGLGELPRPDKWKFKCKYFETPEEWFLFAKDIRKGEGKYLLQEFIKGKYVGIGIAMQGKNAVAKFQWMAVREYEPGLGGLRKSMPLDPLLSKQAEVLCRAIHFEGVCEVEFRGEVGNNEYTLMEINPRLWGGVRLPIICGIDFPYLAFSIYKKENIRAVSSYKTGIYSRNFLGDLKWFLNASVKNRYIKDMPNIQYKRWKAILDFVKSTGKASVHDLENKEDLMPAIKHYNNKIREMLPFGR